MRWRSGQTIACLVRESALSLTPVINGDDVKGQDGRRTLQSELKERRAESKGVGKDSRSALYEVAVVRGIGIIACMGQKHVGVLGSRSSFLVRPGCGVFLDCFQFPFVREEGCFPLLLQLLGGSYYLPTVRILINGSESRRPRPGTIPQNAGEMS